MMMMMMLIDIFFGTPHELVYRMGTLELFGIPFFTILENVLLNWFQINFTTPKAVFER